MALSQDLFKLFHLSGKTMEALVLYCLSQIALTLWRKTHYQGFGNPLSTLVQVRPYPGPAFQSNLIK